MTGQKLKPGVFIPVITPFSRANMIDFKSLERQINYLIASGTGGIVVAGTTGEGQLLSLEEKMQLIDFTTGLRKKSGKSFAVIAGTGTQKIEEAIEIAKHAEQNGCEAALALPPRAKSQKEIEKFYQELSRQANIPILAYNIPKHSGTSIAPSTLARLVGKTRVIGVKDSSQDPKLLKQWKRAAPKAFLVVGEDTLINFAVRKCRADAAIPGTGNVFPAEVVNVFRKARQGKGEKEQAILNEKIKALVETGNFGSAVKAILRKRGIITTEKRRIRGKLPSKARKTLFRKLI